MSKSISEIDQNLAVETICNLPIVFRNAMEEPFSIHGLCDPHDTKPYHRIPQEVADATNEGVKWLNLHTSGGRVRFKTSSPHLAVKVKLSGVGLMPHMTLVGTAGLDVYLGGYEGYPGGYRYHASCMTEGGNDAAIKMTNNHGYTNMVWLPTEGMKDVLLNLPLYGGIDELWIGLSPDATVEAAEPYRDLLPTVYYGSSITQGGCATHPGVCYEPIISRRFNADFINLGFAGAAKGESVMADYVADLDMSIFVLDYDHNATLTQYAETHEPFYKTVRAKNPDLPIIIMTRPKYEKHLIAEEYERIEIARKTYENAKARGENVYFIPGYELMSIARGDGVVDGCHPTDLGFYSMAERLSAELEKILNK